MAGFGWRSRSASSTPGSQPLSSRAQALLAAVAGVSLLVYVADVDAVFTQALAAGAVQLRPVQNQFYGDRSGTLRDPFGHVWSIATHIEDLSNEEICERSREMLARRCKKLADEKN